MNNKEKKTHFNKLEFEKVRALAADNPLAGLEAYQSYMEKYQEDYSARMYYIGLLILIGKLDEAEKLLNSMKKIYSTKLLYQRNNNKARIQKYNIHFCTMKLLAYQNRHQELIDYYDEHRAEMTDLGPEVKFYYDKLMGKEYIGVRENNSYLYRQMIEYREDDFKEHITKHMADYNGNDRKISKSFFSHDFPIYEVIEEVKKYIPSDKKLNTGFIQNIYVFKYDECGRDNNKLVDYFIVTVFKDTCNFITMCPSSDYKYYDFVDLNYMKEKKDEADKPKVLSRIEKFNQRYKRNV